MRRPTEPLPQSEFVALVALMFSIVAMATDIMLPALGIIGRDLSVADPNDTQLVVSSLFAGFAIGQIFAGPISDAIGRKPAIYIGYTIFICGCILSLTAQDLQTMLIGRVLQGLGAAPCRIITVAMVRDSYAGRAMAKIMSIALSIFILVPAIAPAVGQGILLAFSWHDIFVFLIIMAIISTAWLAFRQPETLPPEKRRAFSLVNIFTGLREIMGERVTVGYTLATGCVFGCFLGYLSSTQQIFQTSYGVGEMFPLYFAIAALAIGVSSVTNSRLVMRLGMRVLSIRALISLTAFSAVFFLMSLLMWDGLPPMWTFLVWQVCTFLSVGMLFGNLNALAMEPLGHMAGLGSAFVGSISSFLSLPLGWAIGRLYDGSVLPLVGGFAILGAAALVTSIVTERHADTSE